MSERHPIISVTGSSGAGTSTVKHTFDQIFRREGDNYWYMWKLPLFGESDINVVMNEINACRNANPGNHVRLIGYDNKRQTQGLSMVVYRGDR